MPVLSKGKIILLRVVNLVSISRLGIFLLKQWEEKTGWNISKGNSVKIPAHYIAALSLPKNL
jgi:nucleoid DNA-binding protein